MLPLLLDKGLVLVEKFIEQHRVHLIVADAAGFTGKVPSILEDNSLSADGLWKLPRRDA